MTSFARTLADAEYQTARARAIFKSVPALNSVGPILGGGVAGVTTITPGKLADFVIPAVEDANFVSGPKGTALHIKTGSVCCYWEIRHFLLARRICA